MSEQDNTKTERSVVGRVVSDKGNKTITVLLERRLQHELYGKFIRRSTKVHAHDEDNAAKTGDLVRIASCRPISKQKNWRLLEVVESAVIV